MAQMSIMLEKITVGFVPSPVVRGARLTEEILQGVVTGIQDAIGRVYWQRTRWSYEGIQNGGLYVFDCSPTNVRYEITELDGKAQALMAIEGGQGLDPQPTGTFLRAMLERHELLEKDGDVDAEFVSENATETGQAALRRFNVRVAVALRYEDGHYKRVELFGSAAGR